TYLNSSLKKITSSLKPRYVYIDYYIKEGDTYEGIISSINIPIVEKKLFLSSVAKNKNVKILKLNHKIFFTIDKRNQVKIVNFTIEIDNKKNFFFEKIDNDETFVSKIIEKNMLKNLINQCIFNQVINDNKKKN
ncbi:MAG TPA: hypothetical protein QGG51_03635, partial [Candidatus Pelagibacter bacterium]|nr:hypothetical protein [Candidatus Pelagibacter bacterium]